MDRKITFEDFDIKVTLNDIQISQGGSSITLVPAETDKVKTLVASSVSGGGVRGFLQNTPFRVLFYNDDKDRVLIRKGMEQSDGLKFYHTQTDALVEAVTMALNMFVDGQIHRGGGSTAQVKSAFEVPEPPIEGR